MVYSLGYAVTPASITSLFAYSVGHHILGGNLVYLIMMIIGILGAVQCLLLKDLGSDSGDDAAEETRRGA